MKQFNIPMEVSTAKKIWHYHAYGRDGQVLSNSRTSPCTPNSGVISTVSSIEQISPQSSEDGDNHDNKNSHSNRNESDIRTTRDESDTKDASNASNASNANENWVDVSDDDDIFQMEGESFHINRYIEEYNRKTCSTIHQGGTPFLSLQYPPVISSMC